MREEIVFSRWMKRSSNGNRKGEMNKTRIHIYLFKLLEIDIIVLIMIFMFQ
jgi:hypothetical protein